MQERNHEMTYSFESGIVSVADRSGEGTFWTTTGWSGLRR